MPIRKANKAKLPEGLGLAIREMAKKAGISVSELGRQAGAKVSTMNGITYGGVKSLQKDLALRFARITKSDPSLLQSFLAVRAPHGFHKKKKIAAQKKMAEIFKVICPNCEGSGSISVRKV